MRVVIEAVCIRADDLGRQLIFRVVSVDRTARLGEVALGIIARGREPRDSIIFI